MVDYLLDFLNSKTTDDFFLINDLLKTHNQYKEKSTEELNQYLSKLTNSGKIEFKNNAPGRLGTYIKLNPNDKENTYINLDNWPMLARVTEKYKQQIQINKKAWYDTENAIRQYEDYPKQNKELSGLLDFQL